MDLLRAGLYTCGTMRSNRKGFPVDFKPFTKKSRIGERGASKCRQSGNLTVTLWQDTKLVTMVSTLSDPTADETILRKLKDGSTITIMCPLAIRLYNIFMGGVDYNDQLRKYYQFRLKSKKFYKYIFWFLVELSITNAFILCKHHTNLNIITMKDFRSQLASSLIGSYSGRKRRGRPSTTLPMTKRMSLFDHWPMRGAEKSHRCHYCQVQMKRRRETVWKCSTCDIFLCHNGRDDDCFLAYHTNNEI